ncbi:hypothetical protein [uncultured Thiodictyon sp.]|uniref:hypothetical protein n=1 Tax=uncultured Thiodictyon sp. TaxID=1846217 RepID=UPI0025F84A44|nr:hypothetical protein [uncultured Thiodictyon sp.]
MSDPVVVVVPVLAPPVVPVLLRTGCARVAHIGEPGPPGPAGARGPTGALTTISLARVFALMGA